MVRGGGFLKIVILRFFFWQKNVAKKIHHTRTKHMIDNPVSVGRVYLPDKNYSL